MMDVTVVPEVDDTLRGRLRVSRVTLVVGRPLPVYPDQRTSSAPDPRLQQLTLPDDATRTAVRAARSA
jgi:hypothetical protein